MSLSLYKWATPLVAGAFLLMAATGILMFFHLDTGLNKAAHEWLGWVFVIGAAFHIFSNFPGFKKKMAKPLSIGIAGIFVTLLLLSFIPLEKGGNNGKMIAGAAMNSLASAPISVVAQVTHADPQELLAALNAGGMSISSADMSINDAVGQNPELRMKALSLVFNQK
ncbi:MAG: hypothetical protein AUJ12_06950 [Alphaproteobacteria bacterium CG1_02_46_17]|nr:MAG: hypothetical protein AUJ12_06950 [Alphaproteobacteria bacterium CG1_02_46_17]